MMGALPRRGGGMARTLLVCWCVIVLALAVGTLAAAASSGAEGAKGDGNGRTHRCFRPFSSLDSFSPKDMRRRDNCAFDFLQVDSAAATVRCQRTVAAPATATTNDDDDSAEAPLALGGAGEEGHGLSCTVGIDVAATPRLPKEWLITDGARYTLRLASDAGPSIHYKGFDGKGYSVCCALFNDQAAMPAGINQQHGAVGGPSECEWVEANGTQKQRVVHCPFGSRVVQAAETRRREETGAATGGEEATLPSVDGFVERPLHNLEPGAWKATLAFHRDTVSDETLVGKLVVPFTVPRAEDVEPAGSTAEVEPSTASSIRGTDL